MNWAERITSTVSARAAKRAVEICNIEAQRRDPGSMLQAYRALIALRAIEPALATGRYQPLRAQGEVLLFKRGGGDDVLVALNLAGREQTVALPAKGDVRLSTRIDRSGERGRTLALRPDEGVILKLCKA